MTHASMLKARRQNQKRAREIEVEAKLVKRLAKEAAAGPVVKKEKVKTEKIKKEKVATETAKPTKVKKVKPTKEELGRQESKKGKT